MALQKTIIIALIITAVIILTSQTTPQLFSSVGNLGEIEPLPGNNTYQFTYNFQPFGDIECEPEQGCALIPPNGYLTPDLNSPPWYFTVLVKSNAKIFQQNSTDIILQSLISPPIRMPEHILFAVAEQE